MVSTSKYIILSLYIKIGYGGEKFPSSFFKKHLAIVTS